MSIGQSSSRGSTSPSSTILPRRTRCRRETSKRPRSRRPADPGSDQGRRRKTVRRRSQRPLDPRGQGVVATPPALRHGSIRDATGRERHSRNRSLAVAAPLGKRILRLGLPFSPSRRYPEKRRTLRGGGVSFRRAGGRLESRRKRCGCRGEIDLATPVPPSYTYSFRTPGLLA